MQKDEGNPMNMQVSEVELHELAVKLQQLAARLSRNCVLTDATQAKHEHYGKDGQEMIAIPKDKYKDVMAQLDVIADLLNIIAGMELSHSILIMRDRCRRILPLLRQVITMLTQDILETEDQDILEAEDME